MSSNSIRGARVGAGPMGERFRGVEAERVSRSYYCSNGHEFHPQFSADVPLEEIPLEIDCPSCGLPAGQDKANPPQVAKVEPYKTHLAYVQERRTEKEAEQILQEALDKVRQRRIAIEKAAGKR